MVTTESGQTRNETRRPKLPNPMAFEGLGLCFWSGPAVWKCPDKSEWFVSGAVPMGYRAGQFLAREYWVVKPVQRYERAGEIQFTQAGVPLPRPLQKTDSAERICPMVKTLTQIVYASLDRAMTGPDTGDARRKGTGAERLEYLTDRLVADLTKAGVRIDPTP